MSLLSKSRLWAPPDLTLTPPLTTPCHAWPRPGAEGGGGTGMKSSMKHWKQLVLVGMLAWALLFLMLLSYFMDSRTGETRSSAPLSHAETRRLASVQGINRAIMGSPPDPTAAPPPRPGPRPGGYESREGAPTPARTRTRTRTQTLRPWPLSAPREERIRGTPG
ncbi:hypothetical protein ANANG_G00274080 [Anguilla anguilla]|uniref:Uncharacterized protein n=1 Tax=Anguilla anguilla TaxID=7936 RepID=A0A9D3RJY0_ANGAN|nr:hypothetical protein ANANG_G00274080 [Anguilla anguilla]